MFHVFCFLELNNSLKHSTLSGLQKNINNYPLSRNADQAIILLKKYII